MIRLAAIYAWREIRAGAGGLRVALLCLALGVGGIAAVAGLRAGIDGGLAENARLLAGGDLVIDGGAQALPEALAPWLRARGDRLSADVRMRSLLAAPSGARLLVELKAVDDAWPLFGVAGFDPHLPTASVLGLADGRWGAAAAPIVLARLGLHAGDIVRLGDATLTLRAALTDEPDGGGGAFSFGPRVLIDAGALAATGLLQPGALVNHELRVRLPAGRDSTVAAAAEREAVRARFVASGWRIRLAGEGSPMVQRLMDQATLFLTLVGLGALLIGGVGVGMGVRGWLEGRARSIAVLRCLGAPVRLIFAMCLFGVMGLCAVGIGAGLLVGAVLPPAIFLGFGDLLPVPPRIGLYPGVLAQAAATGLLVALLFALAPVARAATIPGAALFRELVLPRGRAMGWRLGGAVVLIGAALVGLVLAGAPDRRFALGFCVAAAATLGLFALAGAGLVRLARHLPRPRAVWARLGVSALSAPANPTAVILVALGVGLSMLTTLAELRVNIGRELAEQVPASAPSLFFIDLQRPQVPAFDALLAATPGLSGVEQVPNMRARVVAINGVPVERVAASADSRWALDGDRGLTWSALPPPGTRIVAGTWWPADYDGPPQLSMDASIARGWGIGLGGVLRLNVGGRDVDLTVTSLRDVQWRSMGINFTLVASPGVLSSAPQSVLASVHADPATSAGLLRRVADALPNVTAIDITELLGALSALVGQVAGGLAGVASLALVSGALVMAGAVAATQKRRVAEAVVLKVLGATRGQIRAAWLVEFALLGLAAGLLAAVVGAGAGWAVTRLVLGADWQPAWGVGLATLLGSAATAVGLGLVGSAPALREKPARWLRIS